MWGINRLFGNSHQVWIKLERTNRGGSLKDRIALANGEDAEQKGLLNKDSVIIEPTSGNTGIGLSLVAAVEGYRLIFGCPESMSIERRRLDECMVWICTYTPRKGMKGAIEKAMSWAAETPNPGFRNSLTMKQIPKFIGRQRLQFWQIFPKD